MKQKQIGLLLAISIIAISFSAIFVKWSDAPPTVMSMYRMYFASVLLLPMVWKRRSELQRLQSKAWTVLVCSGICLALHFALWFASLQYTTVASSTIILALQPIVALVGGFLFYKERVEARVILIILIAIFGVALVGWGDFGHENQIAFLGDVLSFLSVIAVVGYLLIGQNQVKRMSHWLYSFLVFFIAGVALMIYNLVMAVPMVGYEMREWGIFVLLAIFPTVAHVIFNFLLSYINTTAISMSVLGEPVGASILAVILLGEHLDMLQIIGGVLVLIGVSWFLLGGKREVQRE